MSRHVTWAVTGIVFIFITGLVFAACGAPPAATPSPATKAPVSPAPKIAPTAKVDPAALMAKGQEIYQKTAGGMGCQSCHGPGGKGTNLGPNILGRSADDVKRALGSDAMSFIRMTDDDVDAVVAYMKSL